MTKLKGVDFDTVKNKTIKPKHYECKYYEAFYSDLNDGVMNWGYCQCEESEEYKSVVDDKDESCSCFCANSDQENVEYLESLI